MSVHMSATSSGVRGGKLFLANIHIIFKADPNSVRTQQYRQRQNSSLMPTDGSY